MPDVKPSELVAAYAGAYDLLRESVDGLTGEELARRPAPDKWCIKEILCHLMDGEIIWVGRLKRIIAEDNPFLPSYDQDKFAAALYYTDLDTKSVLLTFGMLRSTTVDVLQRLPDEAWQRKGTHDTRGAVTLADMLAVMCGHDANHIKQIRAIRSEILGR